MTFEIGQVVTFTATIPVTKVLMAPGRVFGEDSPLARDLSHIARKGERVSVVQVIEGVRVGVALWPEGQEEPSTRDYYRVPWKTVGGPVDHVLALSPSD